MIAGYAVRPLSGQTRCGDACRWWHTGALWVACIVDGLGHGEAAEIAAQRALILAGSCLHLSPHEMLKIVDRGLTETRGAACGIAQVDPHTKRLRYSAVGNIRGALFSATTRYLDAAPGIAGTGSCTSSVVEVPWTPGDLLALWTDGVSVNLNLGQHSRRLLGAPGKLAELLLDRFAPGNDDALVLCCFLDDNKA
jgi:serine phosphatase RsbU (regulator of sigma subunit)